MTSPVRLDEDYRKRAWKRLSTKHFDVLVVGGGVTGGGVALDAATRGLSTALVEQRDFARARRRARRSSSTAACATSSR